MAIARSSRYVILRGLDLCESTLCSDVLSVRTWVMSALEEQHLEDGAACDGRDVEAREGH